MDTEKLFTLKRDTKQNIKGKLGLPKKDIALGYIDISDESLRNKLCEGFENIDAHFIVTWSITASSKNIISLEKIQDSDIIGYDFFLTDSDVENFATFIEKWVTPLLSKDCNVASLLQPYNPMKSSGNAFLYDSVNIWNLFACVVRYLENYRFPYDNKVLVQNVLKI